MSPGETRQNQLALSGCPAKGATHSQACEVWWPTPDHSACEMQIPSSWKLDPTPREKELLVLALVAMIRYEEVEVTKGMPLQASISESEPFSTLNRLDIVALLVLSSALRYSVQIPLVSMWAVFVVIAKGPRLHQITF